MRAPVKDSFLSFPYSGRKIWIFGRGRATTQRDSRTGNMSFLVQNLRRFARELLNEPVNRIPGKLMNAAARKVARASEQLLYQTGTAGVLGLPCRGGGGVRMYTDMH